MNNEMGNATAGLAGGITKGEGAKKEDTKMPEALSGAAHASDIEYVLGNLTSNRVYAWTPEDYKVSAISLDYLANFIKTGNPNAGKLPEWPVTRPDLDINIMDLNSRHKFYKDPNRARYLFLDSYYRDKK